MTCRASRCARNYHHRSDTTVFIPDRRKLANFLHSIICYRYQTNLISRFSAMCTCCRLYADYDRLQVLLKIARLAKVWRVEHRGPQKIWIRRLIQTLLCNVNVTNFIVKFAINCNWINFSVMLHQMKLIWYFLRIVCVYDEDGRFCSLQARYYGLEVPECLAWFSTFYTRLVT